MKIGEKLSDFELNNLKCIICKDLLFNENLYSNAILHCFPCKAKYFFNQSYSNRKNDYSLSYLKVEKKLTHFYFRDENEFSINVNYVMLPFDYIHEYIKYINKLDSFLNLIKLLK